MTNRLTEQMKRLREALGDRVIYSTPMRIDGVRYTDILWVCELCDARTMAGPTHIPHRTDCALAPLADDDNPLIAVRALYEELKAARQGRGGSGLYTMDRVINRLREIFGEPPTLDSKGWVAPPPWSPPAKSIYTDLPPPLIVLDGPPGESPDQVGGLSPRAKGMEP